MSEIQARLTVKKSGTAGEVPLPAELETAELALNTADRKLYSKDENGTVFPIFTSTTGGASDLVSSVQGKIGDVRLTVDEMDDVSDTSSFGGSWDQEVGGIPAANGEYSINLATPTFYTTDSNGIDQTAFLQLIANGSPVWLSEDEYNWVETTGVGTPVYDSVAKTVQVTLADNWIPTSGKTCISISDPAFYGKENGDILTWSEVSQKWEPKAPGEAIVSLGDLQDVDTTTSPPASGDVLEWNGARWIPGDGSSIVSVTSVNGQSGVVDLGISDMNDYESDGRRLVFKYTDQIDTLLVPAGAGQWSAASDTELRLASRASEGDFTITTGPIFSQLSSGDMIWFSLDDSTYYNFSLTSNVTADAVGAYVFTLSAPGLTVTPSDDELWIALEDPSLTDKIIPEDGAIITYDSAKSKYIPGLAPPTSLDELNDVNSSGKIDGDLLAYNSEQEVWVADRRAKAMTYKFVITPQGIELTGPGLRNNLVSYYDTNYTAKTNNFQGAAPLKVQPGVTYYFDLTEVNFIDPDDLNGNTIRPFVTPWEGGVYTDLFSSGNTFRGEGEWHEASRIFTFTIPQDSTWDRWYLVMGINSTDWESSRGIWALHPQISDSYAHKVVSHFTFDFSEVPDQLADGNNHFIDYLSTYTYDDLYRNRMFSNFWRLNPDSKDPPIDSGPEGYGPRTSKDRFLPLAYAVYGDDTNDPAKMHLKGTLILYFEDMLPYGKDLNISASPIVDYDAASGVAPTSFWIVQQVGQVGDGNDYKLVLQFYDVGQGPALFPRGVDILITGNQKPIDDAWDA